MGLLTRILSLCQDKKTSIYKIERELEFGHGSIRQWKTSDPSAMKVLKVAQYFGVSVDFLLTGKNFINPKSDCRKRGENNA